ncbi:MAG: hypothetical protein FJW35_09310, partial [Acidobacteria bacterium]|nr:hypothetical protein [Acidobacteriota bacterium]
MSEQIFRLRGFHGGLCVLISVLAIHSASAYRIGLSVPDSPGGETVRAVAVDPADPDLLFIATDRGAYRSGDGGTTWSVLAFGVDDGPVDAFVVDPSNPDRVYAATRSGMFESADGGATWSVIPGGIAGFEIMALAVDPRDSATIAAGTEHGLFVSKDRGRTWQSPAGSTVPPETTAFAIDLSRGFAVYAGTAYGGIFASRDGGRTWIPDGSGLSSTHVFSLAVDPGDPGTIYAATNFGLAASSDGGSTWSFFHQGTGNAYLYALAVGRAGKNVIYGGTEHGIHVSEDKGWSWRPLSGQHTGIGEMATRARGADPLTRVPRLAAAEPTTADWVADPDRDGLSSETESGLGTDPANPDSDGDGIRDGLDPDIVAGVVAALPDTVFKSGGPGLRTAMLARLEDIERATAAGLVDVAVRGLQNLLLRVDGCPPLPDPDDWVVDCDAQLTVRNLLGLLAGNHSSWTVDPAVVPSIPSLPGLVGGSPRQTAAVKSPNGDLEEFVVDEVNFRPASAQALNDFLARYNGTVLRGGRPLLL